MQQHKFITNYVFGSTRNLLLGAGLSYSIQNEKYLHIPIIFFFPSTYAGYQMFENKNKIAKWIKDYCWVHSGPPPPPSCSSSLL